MKSEENNNNIVDKEWVQYSHESSLLLSLVLVKCLPPVIGTFSITILLL